MRFTYWEDYELLDASKGQRLERWGDKILIRPDPQIIWRSDENDPRWRDSHAIYHRSSAGGGSWQVIKKLPESWQIKYKKLKFNVKTMNFKHTGVFPEQAVNWDLFINTIKNVNKTVKVLNLFAYTGGATLACASAGAEVCHVDASKGMVSWARENAELSSLSNAKIRWIVDDCEKFVLREIRRNNKYDIIIMDPPSYGRGPNGEFWKIEEKLFDFLVICEKILSDNPIFLAINSYSAGLSSSVMSYMLSTSIAKKRGGTVLSDEIGIPVSNTNLILPAGSTAIINF